MADNVFLVALVGNSVFTEQDPDKFALFVNQQVNHILIKQKAKGTASVSSTTNIAHDLGYVPFCLVFAEVSTGVWRKLYSHPVDSSGVWFELNSTNLVLKNTSGSAKTFAYLIFYDNVNTD